MKYPAWSDPKLPRPGEDGFTSKPGELKLAEDLGGRRRLMSGAGELPYDVASDLWLVDLKETRLESYALKRKKLEQLEARALSEGRQPMFCIVFWSGTHRAEPWMLVRQSTLLGLAELAVKEA